MTLSIALILLSACGGKKVASAKFTLNAAALVAGSNPAGGVFIFGTNGTDKFGMSVTAAQAQNLNVELPFGDWSFASVAWLNNIGNGPMTGKTRCGVAAAKIEGSEATIALNLTHAECASAFFTSAPFQDAVSFGGETTFKKLTLQSCLNPVGVVSGFCDGSTLERLPGEHVSFKVVAASHSTFGAGLPSLQSACFNVGAMNAGQVVTELRLPTSLGTRFPVKLLAYEKSNCLDEPHEYVFSAGAGEVGVDKVQTASSTTDYTFSFADNYIGVTGSAFLDAHTSGKVKLPLVTCSGAHCLQKGTNGPYSNDEFDSIRRQVWSLFGSNDQVDPDDYSPAGDAGNFFSSSTSSVTVNAIGMGSLGNGLDVTLVYSGATGPANAVSCNNPVTINVYDDTGATELASVINSCSASSGLVASAVDNAHIFNVGSTITLSGGSDNLNRTRRHDGEINRIKHMLIGPLGALLFKNGIATGTALCAASGSYSMQFPDELVTLTLGGTTASAVQPAFAPVNQFEKKLTLSFNGVAEQAYYFNCAGDGGNEALGVGAHVSYDNKDGQTSVQQVFWDVTTPGAEIVESNIKHTEGGFNYWKYDLFQKLATGDDWNYWAITGSDQYNSYRTLSSKALGGSLYTYNITAGGPADGTAMTVSAGTDDQWTISTGGFVAGGQTQVGNPSSLQSAPSTAPSYSVNDIVNNTVFWPLSY